MRYDLSRLDNDPSYAPGKVSSGIAFYWRPPKSDLKDGYSIKTYRLNGSDEEMAAKCRELTRELLRWRDGAPKVEVGTWSWIIGRYKSDEFSPILALKANSRASYLEALDKWAAAIGKLRISSTDFETLMLLKTAMEKKGRSVSYIHRMFTHLRIAANYGRAIEPAMFANICAILGSGALKVRTPKPKDTAPTSDQILAIIAEADRAGAAMVALGISLQWWLALRSVDIRGQWLGMGRERRWADGLTWDMIDLRSRTITKMISKTERHDAKAMVWDLTPLPDLLTRLRNIPEDQRIGPVIKNALGRPFQVDRYRDFFRKYARAAGVPDEVKLMDARAGAINDALHHGANPLEVQHAANHKDFKTTERYIRTREVGANKVIALRAGGQVSAPLGDRLRA